MRVPALFSSGRKIWYGGAVLLIAGIGAGRIISTWGVFTQTFDEPFHIACGMQLLQRGIYTIELQHPPLARVAVALGPWLAGSRLPDDGDPPALGDAILNDNNRYRHNLELARLGSLPFFLLACGVVWLWSNHLWGKSAALVSLAVFSLLPAILGHGGLATTDMAAAATLSLALYCFVLWLENPGWRTSVALGAGVGLSMASKFSALLFLPGCMVALIVLRIASEYPRRQSRPLWAIARNLLTALAVAWFVIWAAYFFPLEPITGPPPHPAVDHLLSSYPYARDAVNAILSTRFPAGQLPRSILALAAHNSGGHSAFFLGEWRKGGWWYFFPVIFLVKTPVPFLLLSGAGGVLALLALKAKRDWRQPAPLVAAAVILFLALFTHINIGLRHILAIYIPLSVIAGYGALKLWRSPRAPAICRLVLCAAGLWMAASSVLAHPDYLSWFNFLAFGHPERIEVDSDLDWGQDLARLSTWLRARGVQEVALSYFGTADLTRAGLPPYSECVPYQKTTGWVAISAYNRALPSPFSVTRAPDRAAYYGLPGNFDHVKHQAGPFSWLDSYTPVSRIGKSIFVYYVQ